LRRLASTFLVSAFVMAKLSLNVTLHVILQSVSFPFKRSSNASSAGRPGSSLPSQTKVWRAERGLERRARARIASASDFILFAPTLRCLRVVFVERSSAMGFA
jgi:hypothetical protein